jgi:hypothetical protein
MVTEWSRNQFKGRMWVNKTDHNTRETSTDVHWENLFRTLVHDGHVRDERIFCMVVRVLDDWVADLVTFGHGGGK